ncbi:hypothetical protein DPMN_098263 [Dreissena polymorpha]|uniref:Uncharacterized protein n=1 Tax=Dreissena polymorpha TaxID=45954 RepID=A0A9D4LDC8_DREPO|nr:hypothetical protein DPMN_098263 [Dreissena polymorpha]
MMSYPHQVSELAHSVCDPEDEDLPLVPACLSMDYANVTGVCRPSRAVECLGELEREVFAETSTENRFCT